MSRKPLVIAHRGASGYLPEHTFPAKAMAHAMGADFIEQDILASRDGQLLVFHDLYLDRLTDVAVRFSGRAREDGRHYCIDFTLAELQTLRVTERRAKDGEGARFPGRFPVNVGNFRLHTLEEELDFIQGMNHSTGRHTGVYTEIKEPAWHARQGIFLGDRLIDTLRAFGYRTRGEHFFVESFDAPELRRLRSRYGDGLPLVQLLDHGERVTGASLSDIGTYAEGVGLALSLAWPDQGLVGLAKERGLQVHPFTFRADCLPSGFESFQQLLAVFVHQLEVDGLFTDHPDQVVGYLAEH